MKIFFQMDYTLLCLLKQIILNIKCNLFLMTQYHQGKISSVIGRACRLIRPPGPFPGPQWALPGDRQCLYFFQLPPLPDPRPTQITLGAMCTTRVSQKPT